MSTALFSFYCYGIKYMFFLSDINVEFGRLLGSKDKKKRKSKFIRNIGLGLGSTGLILGLGYLRLKGKGNKIPPTFKLDPKNILETPPNATSSNKAIQGNLKLQGVVGKDNLKERIDDRRMAVTGSRTLKDAKYYINNLKKKYGNKKTAQMMRENATRIKKDRIAIIGYYSANNNDVIEFGRRTGSKDKKKRKVYRLRNGRILKPNQIVNANDGKHKKIVLASKVVNGERKYKVIRFGAKGYGHNYSPEARKNYLKRSGGIRNKSGELTKDDKFSKNYWARKILWGRNTKPSGTGRFAK